FSVLFFARFSACLVAVLVIIWALHFQNSFIPQNPSQEGLIYSVLHPLLMVIGFILISGEAILVAQLVAWIKKFEEISAPLSSKVLLWLVAFLGFGPNFMGKMGLYLIFTVCILGWVWSVFTMFCGSGLL
ncbi:probable transmembrane ascorbate ferrireductase 4, partial [Phtheirospermum japonicum]